VPPSGRHRWRGVQHSLAFGTLITEPAAKFGLPLRVSRTQGTVVTPLITTFCFSKTTKNVEVFPGFVLFSAVFCFRTFDKKSQNVTIRGVN